ncbi:MAG: diguanylate cyclase domain-containing protein [Usitatibacter sp.]
MRRPPYDPTVSEPMTAIVRVAVVVVTLALFFSSSFNAILGNREVAILMALATPLGISAWGFARAGHNEPAMVLLCLVLVTVTTLILVVSPLGVHDVALTAYGGVVLVGALLLSRRAFLGVVAVTLFAATCAFVLDLNGLSRTQILRYSHWSQLVNFLVMTAVFAVLGRVAAEQLFGSLGNAHHAATGDPVTGLNNRAGFFSMAAVRLKAALDKNQTGALVLADLDGFRRTNLVIGHEAADHVLKEVARRLMHVSGEHLVARVGDDEFAVLAVGLAESEVPAFARAIHEALNFEFLGVSVRNGAGYSRFPRDAHGIESLMLGAESALAGAKTREIERLMGPMDRI